MAEERAFPGGSAVRIRLPVWDTWVQSLGREDPLEEEIATHSSILTWKIPWTEEPGRQSTGSQRVGRDQQLNSIKEIFRRGPHDGGLVTLEKFQMNMLRKSVLEEKHFRERILILRESA